MKKAQLAIGWMPLIALALSALALIAMLTFKNDFHSQSSSISDMMAENSFNEQYVKAQASLLLKSSISECPSCSENELKQKLKTLAEEKEKQFNHVGTGNFYGKIRNNEFEITGKTLLMNDLFVESKRGDNKIKRTFNLNINLEQMTSSAP